MKITRAGWFRIMAMAIVLGLKHLKPDVTSLEIEVGMFACFLLAEVADLREAVGGTGD